MSTIQIERRFPSERVQQRGFGFTLIELLVVTAVIAVLVAMLLPALRSAKEASRSSKCLSNLHQIGLALAMYVQENRDSFPGWYVYEYGGAGGTNVIAAPSWPTYLTRAVPNLYQGGASYDQNVFHCPTIAKTLNVYNINQLTVWTWPTVYTANINLLGNCGADAPCPIKITAVSKPPETVFCADSRLDNLHLGIWEPALVYPDELDPDPAVNPGSRGVGHVHNGNGNVLYVDGHAAGFPKRVPGTTYP